MIHDTDLSIKQIWNLHPDFEQFFSISAKDEENNTIPIKYQSGYYAELYGILETTKVIVFETDKKVINTTITLK